MVSPTKARKIVKVEVELDADVPSSLTDGIVAGGEVGTVVWKDEVKREREE